MAYPSLEQVEAADHEQLTRWSRFLPSPGASAIPDDPGEGGTLPDGWQERVEQVRLAEAPVLDRILRRLQDLGGMTPELSKRIGWRP